MADVPTAGAARYASVAEVRADVERAGGDASALCGFGRCLCFKTALGISGGKERGHWPQFQESERSNRVLEQLGQDRKDVLRSGRRAAVGAMMAFDARDLDVLRRASCG